MIGAIMRRIKILTGGVIALFVVTGVWQGAQWYLRWRVSGPQWLANQIWVERIPRDERDMFFHLIMVEHDNQRIGVAGRSSNWRSRFDLFRWSVKDDVVSALFPQDNRRLSMKARTWACAGEAPKPFELCLELKGPRQSFRLYSLKEWVIRPRQEVPADVRAPLAPALAAAEAAPATQSLPAAEAAGDDGVSLIE
jgi:hypothetical protein